ncbi:hypothetical protein PC129_g14541 [Phytophthora cactorum]|uniref:Uncharacterized protein n=1 Tax=Phytophthora cactorum TaxID=29920 RepID=A0A329RMN4_9STRA|nr:hypothetical protein Pcac1_g7548 [Phytophthora cactorum]KAG2799453.1 hypothetical protein PC111_g20426 [Phytophthora cactorum]KAG2819362.1 hypothetical protein PC112_g12226 [Phytophthora cactorum]KAG2855138.1 hypothetical protein PC113_g12719 [Phytophthora cactorum]KAG2878415.1 hypothetical protein PC114_g23136 [Phytophthora cactorum]
MANRHAVRLETEGIEYRLFPPVHVSKLKLVKTYPDRPTTTLTSDGANRVDFDESLLPEDSWERELDDNEFEVDWTTNCAQPDVLSTAAPSANILFTGRATPSRRGSTKLISTVERC